MEAYNGDRVVERSALALALGIVACEDAGLEVEPAVIEGVY